MTRGASHVCSWDVAALALQNSESLSAAEQWLKSTAHVFALFQA